MSRAQFRPTTVYTLVMVLAGLAVTAEAAPIQTIGGTVALYAAGCQRQGCRRS